MDTKVLQVRKGDEIDSLVLAPVGTEPGKMHYTIDVFMTVFRSTALHVAMGCPCCSALEPFQVLNELRPEGFRIECCATCPNFHFSGMLRDMSAGSRGYRSHPATPKSSSSLPFPVVSVFYRCPEYPFIENRDRHPPYRFS